MLAYPLNRWLLARWGSRGMLHRFGTAGGIVHRLYGLAGSSWTENGITWSSMPANGSLLGSWTVPAAGTPVEVDVTAAVAGALAGSVSQHLAKLRLARMVTTRQEGTRVYYQLTDERVVATGQGALPRATRHHDLGVLTGSDLGADDETNLAQAYDKPVFVMNYPKEAKAFYMKENPDDPRTVLCDDLLAPEGYGEMIGGSQREDDYDKLLHRIKEEGLDPAAYDWYLDLRKYGTFVHSGFGLGLERTVAWICGLPHIREVIAFPRMMNRLRP